MTEIDKKEIALARALETALTEAQAGGLPPGNALSVLAKAVGYSVANGSPSLNQTLASLHLFFRVAGMTADEVFQTRGAGMPTAGNA